jgi:hypothetical protein
MNLYFVIPAQTGIQRHHALELALLAQAGWIPACAVMTTLIGLCA